MDPTNLGRRERQIMAVVFRLERATVKDVLAGLAEPPTYSTVRAMLGKLEQKGYVSHVEDGPRYVYLPAVSKEKARRTAVENLVQTFFDGSAPKVVSALLDSKITEAELSELSKLIEQAKRERQK